VAAESERDGLRDRGLGALLGQAAGDALGTTVEFSRGDDIAARHPGGLREIVGGGPFRVLAGQVTDDTELALALARSLAERGTYDSDDVAGRYVGWLRSGPFDVGRTTRSALTAEPGHGVALRVWANAAAIAKGNEANGSLMRASPLGVFGWQLEPDELARLAALDSRMTHASPACQAACVVFTHAVARAIRTGAPPRDLAEATLAWARGRADAAWAVPVLEDAMQGPPPEYQHHMGWVGTALRNAFWHLVSAPSFEEGVVRTVMAGGDADTNACIAGALLGAAHGAGAVPAQWRSAVLGVRTWRPAACWCVDLPELAEKLLFCRTAAEVAP
jgi:ADP-ribosylglycohydrolase